MIYQYSLSNFKIHKRPYQFDLQGLNIFTGANHSGKTSIIESIRALAFWANNCIGYNHLPLEYIDYLLQPQDILNKDVPRKEHIVYEFTLDGDASLQKMCVFVEFASVEEMQLEIIGQSMMLMVKMSICLDDHSYEILLDEQNVGQAIFYKVYFWDKDQNARKCDFRLSLTGITASVMDLQTVNEDANKLLQLFDQLYKWFTVHKVMYLAGIRSADPFPNVPFGSPLQASGCNSAEVLERNKNLFCYDGNHTIQQSFEYWTKKILGYDIQIRQNNNQYYYIVNENGVSLKMKQSGLGISQILPVIVTILLCKKNDLLMIENPEVHLHPKWKTGLVDLFYDAVQNGIQILLETQSIEIINRIRRKSREDEEKRNCTRIWFCEKEGFECNITQLEIKEDGGLDYWPDDFVDQVTLEDSFALM